MTCYVNITYNKKNRNENDEDYEDEYLECDRDLWDKNNRRAYETLCATLEMNGRADEIDDIDEILEVDEDEVDEQWVFDNCKQVGAPEFDNYDGDTYSFSVDYDLNDYTYTVCYNEYGLNGVAYYS